MKRFRKILLVLISFMSLASCEEYTISETKGFNDIPIDFIFIVNCDIPDQVYTVALPGMDDVLETTNTFEFHSVDKEGNWAGCYLTCKNPQATLTIQRYVNRKRIKTIYGKSSVVFNAKDDMFPFLQ